MHILIKISTIDYAVSVVSQFMHAPHVPPHMETVHKVLRYLDSTPGKGIVIVKV